MLFAIIHDIFKFYGTAWKGYDDAFPDSIIKIVNCGLLLVLYRDHQSDGYFRINTSLFNLKNVYDSAHGILSQSILVQAGVLFYIIAI